MDEQQTSTIEDKVSGYVADLDAYVMKTREKRDHHHRASTRYFLLALAFVVVSIATNLTIGSNPLLGFLFWLGWFISMLAGVWCMLEAHRANGNVQGVLHTLRTLFPSNH